MQQSCLCFLEPAAHESSFKKTRKKLYVNYTSIIKKKKKGGRLEEQPGELGG